MVMLGQSENRLLLIVIPNDDIRIFAFLTARKQLTIVTDRETSDLVVVSGKEVLIVRILQITHHDARSSHQDELFQAWMQVH